MILRNMSKEAARTASVCRVVYLKTREQRNDIASNTRPRRPDPVVVQRLDGAGTVEWAGIRHLVIALSLPLLELLFSESILARQKIIYSISEPKTGTNGDRSCVAPSSLVI